MSGVSDEGRTLHVEDQTKGLATSGEGEDWVVLLHLVHVSVCGNNVEVPVGVLGGAVDGNFSLENHIE